MPKLFGVDIAGILATQLGPQVLPVTLKKVSENTRTSNAVTAGLNPQTSSYNCRGFIDDYDDYELSNTAIQTSDKKILLLGGTLPVNIIPMTGDIITIEGSDYTIIRVRRDPAAATYTCQSRGQ